MIKEDEPVLLVWSAGYECVGIPDQGQFLIEKAHSKEHQPSIIVQPEAALFRNFADTPTTSEGIEGFATKYGLLGGEVTKQIELPARGLARADRVDTWYDEIRYMREAISLWMLSMGQDPRARYTHPDETPIASIIPLPAVSATLQHVRQKLRSIVNERLTKHNGRFRLQEDPTTSRDMLKWIQNGLIATLWLQVARAIAEERQYAQCEVCSRWFEISQDKREGAKFCRDICRFRAYRQRQEDACVLHHEGCAISEIAARLGSDPSTVGGWIARNLHSQGESVEKIGARLGFDTAVIKGWVVKKRRPK